MPSSGSSIWSQGHQPDKGEGALHYAANGCCMTDPNTQEGQSFRVRLNGPPLILVLQCSGVHGNKGIIISTDFNISPLGNAVQAGEASGGKAEKRKSIIILHYMKASLTLESVIYVHFFFAPPPPLQNITQKNNKWAYPAKCVTEGADCSFPLCVFF